MIHNASYNYQASGAYPGGRPSLPPRRQMHKVKVIFVKRTICGRDDLFFALHLTLDEKSDICGR